MTLTKKIKDYVCTSLLIAAPLVGVFAVSEYGNLTRGSREGYYVASTQGIEQGEVKKVKSFSDEYKYAEPWRAIAHYYDPWVIRHVKFTDNSQAILEYELFANCSMLKRKVFGPEPGEKYILEKHRLRKLKQEKIRSR